MTKRSLPYKVRNVHHTELVGDETYYPIQEGELRRLAGYDYEDPEKMIDVVISRGTCKAHPHEISIELRAARKAREELLAELQKYGIENSWQEESKCGVGFVYRIDAIKFDAMLSKKLKSLQGDQK